MAVSTNCTVITGYSVAALRQGPKLFWAVQQLDQAASFAPWPAAAWSNLDEHYWVVVAAGDGETPIAKNEPALCGFALAHQGLDGDWHLLNLTVAPASRRQGVGRALLHYLQHLAEVASIYLEVAESNIAARELYRQGGFQELCRKKAFYQDGQAAFALQWRRDDT